MEHKIKYFYRTGDSFTTVEREELLEFSWTDLTVAKEALKRIKEHYEWYKSINRNYFNEDVKERPKWHKVTSHYKGDEKYLINLPLDNGKEIQMTCPWVGYFEALYGAEIISEDNDMKFETGER